MTNDAHYTKRRGSGNLRRVWMGVAILLLLVVLAGFSRYFPPFTITVTVMDVVIAFGLLALAVAIHLFIMFCMGLALKNER